MQSQSFSINDGQCCPQSHILYSHYEKASIKHQASHYLLNKHHCAPSNLHILFHHFIIIEALSSPCFGWMAGLDFTTTLCCFFQLQAHIKQAVTTSQQQQSRITNSKAQTCGPNQRPGSNVWSPHSPPVHRHHNHNHNQNQHVGQM